MYKAQSRYCIELISQVPFLCLESMRCSAPEAQKVSNDRGWPSASAQRIDDVAALEGQRGEQERGETAKRP